MSASGPRGRTTRRSLARLHADALLLHGSEEGATAGRTPDSAKVAAFDQPAGARIPWSIARPPGVDSVSAPDAQLLGEKGIDLPTLPNPAKIQNTYFSDRKSRELFFS